MSDSLRLGIGEGADSGAKAASSSRSGLVQGAPFSLSTAHKSAVVAFESASLWLLRRLVGVGATSFVVEHAGVRIGVGAAPMLRVVLRPQDFPGVFVPISSIPST